MSHTKLSGVPRPRSQLESAPLQYFTLLVVEIWIDTDRATLEVGMTISD